MMHQAARNGNAVPGDARRNSVARLAGCQIFRLCFHQALQIPAYIHLKTLCLLAFFGLLVPARAAPEIVPGPPLRFAVDTFAFANQTVFIYPHGHAEPRQQSPAARHQAGFTLRCFAMCRSVEQFHKFARFEPALPPPDDATLARLVRQINRHAVWRRALPLERRVVIPGYAGLHQLSAARPQVVQASIGGGWTVYVRPGNYRMFSYALNGPRQQAHTQKRLEDTLARNDLFIAYLTTFPKLSINHAVVIYGRRPATRADTAAGVVHYLVYDPNHPDRPRDLAYDTRRRTFSYQKDWDFVGGNVTVLQVYSYPGQ